MTDDDSTTQDDTSNSPAGGAAPQESTAPVTPSTTSPAEAEATGIPAVPGAGAPEAPTAEQDAPEAPAVEEDASADGAPEDGAPEDGAPEDTAARTDADADGDDGPVEEPEPELPRFAAPFSSPEPTAVIARPRRRATRPSFAAEPAEAENPPPATAAAFISFVAPSATDARPAPRRRGRRPAEALDTDSGDHGGESEAPPAEDRDDLRDAGTGGSRSRRSRSRRRPGDEPGEARESVADDAEDDVEEIADVADDETGDEAEDDTSAGSRRRRRGRRGRGRGRTGEDAAEGDDDVADEAVENEDEDEDGGETEAEDSASSTRRRRRRRRRGGSGGGEAAVEETDDDDRPERAGRNGRTTSDDDVRGVAGSTRLEAKRQRRRDGRDTGRRRAPILTESEFLARREAVDRKMVIRQRGERTQIAVLEDDILVEHYVTQAQATSFAGNIYLGRVQNVLPSMEAAFVDVGKGRNAVLYAGEVNWDAVGLSGKSRSIETALKSGDKVLVQVTKDPIGHKGARLTQQINLPGRFLVYVPGGSMTGISRKLPDTERQRLKDILKKIVPEDAGVIIRTAAEGASEEELTRDVNRLTAQWEVISKKAESTSSAPTLLYGEPDLAIRVIRDVFNEDFKELVVQGDDAWDTVEAYVAHVSPELTGRLTRYTGEGDVFSALRIDEQLAKALDRKVWLPSGGSLVIDRTEAMTVVDVNTGKFIGSGGNLEQTVTRNNMEAAEEIVRQLRLRDVGGIIVIDFIDMVLESNRDLVLRRLTECLGRDRTKHQVAEVTSLGLVQMTRKRVGQGLLEVFSEPCDHCRGRGVIISTDPVDERRRSGGNGGGVSSGGGHAAGGGGGTGRRDRSGSRETPREDTAKVEARTDGSGDGAVTGDAAGTGDDVGSPESAEGAGARSGGRRNRGRRGRGQSGEDRAAEDAAVLDAAVLDGGRVAARADEVADYRPEDSSEDLPPAAQTPLDSDADPIVPPDEVPADGVPADEVPADERPEELLPRGSEVLGSQAVEAVGVTEEIPASGRPRRRRAASRPAGPPVL